MDFRPLTCENVLWNERIDMQEIVDTVVIGAGVIGLAVARELAQRGREVWLLEQAGAIGQGISARSSEVVHAGIYYPIGSWKARLCVEGRELLYGYCAARGVPFRRLGKLVIATEDAQLPLLESMVMRARAPVASTIWSCWMRMAWPGWNRRCAAGARCRRRPPASSTAMR